MNVDVRDAKVEEIRILRKRERKKRIENGERKKERREKRGGLLG